MDIRKKKIAGISLFIIIAIFVFSAVFSCAPFDIVKDNQQNDIPKSNLAFSITSNDTDGLGEFADGVSYIYTDKNKVNDFRAGTTDLDMTTHKVAKTSSNRGKIDNPYVIASEDDWDRFAKNLDDGSIPNKGSGQYFVLAKDLDFTDRTFRPVRFFNGTFYGIGHKLQNISLYGAQWQYWNGSTYAQIPTSGAEAPLGYGVFCRIVGATIADLIVENFNYQQMAETSPVSDRVQTSTGGIVGYSYGNDYFLNCHTSGVVSSTITYGATVPAAGGLVGAHSNVSADLYIYRCSAEFNITASSSAYPMQGGLLGDCSSGGNVYIYDCVANITATLSACIHTGCSAAIGLIERGTTLYIENFVGYVNINSTIIAAAGALIGAFNNSIINSIENCYIEGQYGAVGSKYAYYGVAGGTVTINAQINNINVVKPTNMSYWTAYYSRYGNRLNGHKEYPDSDGMISAAKSFFGAKPYSKIWDVAKIGGKYDPDNSPVRNYLLAFVTYRNLTGGGNSEVPIELKDGKKDGDGFVEGDTLYEPSDSYMTTKPNHEFLGWTDDKSGDSEPFTELPAGFYGDVTLYAVWGLPKDYSDANITSELTLKDNVSEITYDSKSSITLIADVKDKGGAMTSPVKTTYYWEQGSKDKKKDTTGQLSVKSVADSGNYTYRYRLQDSNEPLWMYYDNTSAVSKSVKINPGELSLKSFALKTETKAYNGRPLSELEYDLKVQNSANVEVGISTSGWYDRFGEVSEGKNKTALTIEPTDTENYKSSYQIEIEFDSVALQITFKMAELVGQELKVNVEYGNNYGTKEIIYEFNKVYLDALENNPAYKSIAERGMLPYLANADELEANASYKGAPLVEDSSGAALYDAGTRYNKIKEEKTITVFFHEATYRVTFKSPYAWEGTPPADANYGYGKFIVKPDDPTYQELLFVGWYFTDSEGEYRAWRFNSKTENGTVIPQDRVTGNVELTAEFLSAKNLEEVVFEVNATAKFEALKTIDSGDYLTVTAKYWGEKDGHRVSKDVTKEYDDYKTHIEYGRMDGDNFVADYKTLKVVEGGMYIRVGIEFNGEIVYSAPQKITVTPKDITEVAEKINLGDNNGEIVEEYDGASKALPEISESLLNSLTGGQITGVEYEYENILTGEKVDEPINVGTYIVTVKYKTASNDLQARAKTITLKIVTQQKVKVEWTGSKLMYNGGEQYPKVAKVYDAETGKELPINLDQAEYSGDTQAKAVGAGYKVSVSLGNAYNIVEGAECEFIIDKATLKIPTYTAGSIFYDGSEKELSDYLGDMFNPLLMEIVNGGSGKEVNTYVATIRLKDTINCNWEDGTFGTQQIRWQIEAAQLIVTWDKWEFVSDGESAYAPKISSLFGLVGEDSFNYETDFIYKIYDEEGNLLDVSEVSEIGSYRIAASFNGDVKNYVLDKTSKEWNFVVVPKSGMTILTIEWGETQFLYDGSIHYPTYVVKDANGNDVTSEMGSILKFSEGYRKEKELGTYSVKVTLSNTDEYFIRSGATCKYKIVDEHGYAPDEDETGSNGDDNKDPDDGSNPIDLGNIGEILKNYWQPIVSVISIILILIFTGKGIGYASKKKENKRLVESKYSTFYAAAGTGLFGLNYTNWTIIASVLMGVAVLSFVFMLIEKKGYKKSQRNLDDAKDEFARNEAKRRDDDMKMMFMQMMGGNAGQGQPQGYAYAQHGLGAEDIRGIVSETMTAMLPGMQQMLPQQASVNDELVQKLVEQNARNEEVIKSLAQGQEKLMKKLAEKPAEKEVVTANVNEEVLDRLASKLQPAQSNVSEEVLEKLVNKLNSATNDETLIKVVNRADQNDETIKRILDNQDKLMEKILELSMSKSVETQVVEKVVEVPVEKVVEKEVRVEVPVEVEKIVEKEVPVEKIVEVPVEVEKIVEKEVIKEVPVEVEKVVEKIVEIPAEKPAPKAKTVAPRLTLDEAYAKLSAKQKKFFDTLKEYAMSKDKCKEKKSTYYILLGQSSVNPLVKLTIKKDSTVALFKMEDEYMKDIRRNATNDGTKVKVKETELIVGDAQALATAKEMIDLREDQIERYNDFLKEQRSMKKR